MRCPVQIPSTSRRKPPTAIL